MRNLALMWVLAGCLLGCGGKPSYTKFTDTRDGKVYKIVKIGSQTWFAENLNYAVEGSVCYENNARNCVKYGRMYNWNDANSACPTGWHLPLDIEWTMLENYVKKESGCRICEGTKLKSTKGWGWRSSGTNDFGFSAFPGGYGTSEGNFYYAGIGGFWWSATDGYFYDTGAEGIWWRAADGDAYDAFYWNMSASYDGAGLDHYNKTILFSVRCVQDNEKEVQK